MATRTVRHRAPPDECTCLANPDADAVLMNPLASHSSSGARPHPREQRRHTRCVLKHTRAHMDVRWADELTTQLTQMRTGHLSTQFARTGSVEHADVSGWANPRTTRREAQLHYRRIRLIAPRRALAGQILPLHGGGAARDRADEVTQYLFAGSHERLNA